MTRLLTIETGNMYQNNVGPEGLEPTQLHALQDQLAVIHERIGQDTRAGLEAIYACLTLHTHMPATTSEIKAMAQEIRQTPHVFVIGIGGSSLGAKAVLQALKPDRQLADDVQLYFVENIDPYHLETLFTNIDPGSAAVITISKSGGTIETVVQYQIIRDWLRKHLGPAAAARRQWVITDPASGWLRDTAAREQLPSLAVPPMVGGRYSVLTPVGLLPLAVAGIDIDQLLAGAGAMATHCQANEIAHNPVMELAALYYLLATEKDKTISVMMPYVNQLQLYVDWYCQLWAESLGKLRSDKNGSDAAGSLPVRAMGAVDQHSQLQMYLESRHNKMFSFIALQDWQHDLTIPLDDNDRNRFPYLEQKSLADVITAEFYATRQVITETGHPNLSIMLPELNAHVLGQLIDLYQRVTVYTGLLYGINPLDQPSVEKGKVLAIDYLKSH